MVHHWEQAEPGDTYDALNEIYKGNADRVKKGVQNRIGNIDKAIKGVQKKMDAIDNSDDFDAVAAQSDQYDQLRQQKDELEQQKKYWQSVLDVPQQREAERARKKAEEQAALDAQAHDAAAAQAQADYEARKKAEAERKAVGNENPMPEITERWKNANKINGNADEIVLPNGERVRGHYVLHESGASSPSHNPVNWHKTEGFPMDANDNTVNDRDYEQDSDAQQQTKDMAKNYDQRALQSPVVVSQDGVVLSGNGRTMAGELAARDNTDGAYVSYLHDYAGKYGFTPEQVESMQHPRVSFVPDERMPYTAETFAKFNQQEMKSQNKTEQAVSDWFADKQQFIKDKSIDQIPGLLDSVGLGKMGGKVQNGLDAFSSASGAAADFASGNYIGAAFNGISAIKSFGSALGIGGGNGAKVAETTERLKKSNERLGKRIDDLTDTIGKSACAKAMKAYDTAVKAQEKINKNNMEILKTQMRYHGAHHSNAHYADDSKIASYNDDAQRAFKAAGVDSANITGLDSMYSLSPEQLNAIRVY